MGGYKDISPDAPFTLSYLSHVCWSDYLGEGGPDRARAQGVTQGQDKGGVEGVEVGGQAEDQAPECWADGGEHGYRNIMEFDNFDKEGEDDKKAENTDSRSVGTKLGIEFNLTIEKEVSAKNIVSVKLTKVFSSEKSNFLLT